VFFLIELFENLDAFWTRIDHHKLNTSNNSLLSLLRLREMRVILVSMPNAPREGGVRTHIKGAAAPP
jgi:hypothetical protein